LGHGSFREIRPADDADDASAGAEFVEAYKSQDPDEDSTVKTARIISRRVFHRELPEEQKERAGLAVHYAFGSTVGALYGALCEVVPALARGAGLPFGTAVWLGANEIAVPAFRLGKPPTRVPLSEHVFSLATHFVYGLTTDTVRRLIRRALGEPTRAT
jgi:putative membrane protein